MSDPAKQYSASEAAALLLRDYREHRENFRVFDDFDKAMSGIRASVDKSLGAVDEPLNAVAKRLFKICRDGFFLIQVSEWKINYIAEAILHSIKAGNPLSLAGSTRGLVEHIAAMMFIVETLEKLSDALDSQGSEVKINEALSKAEATMRRCYFGKSPKGSGKGESAPHIESECLEAFAKQITDIREVYDFLCDYVHPNFGSNLLVSSGQLGRGRLNPEADFHQETIDRICRYCSMSMIFLRDDAVRVATPIIRLQDLIERCLARGAKMSTVFTRKSAKPEGDGKSKETAYFFPKARTAAEAIELTYRFLQESGFAPAGNKKIGVVEQGFIYDVFPTSSGELWFKIPVK